MARARKPQVHSEIRRAELPAEYAQGGSLPEPLSWRTAIFSEEEVPPNWASYIAKNRDVFQSALPLGAPKR
jgi:hypothetical protein